MLWFFEVWAAAQCLPCAAGPCPHGDTPGLAGMVAPHCPWPSDVTQAFSAPADSAGHGLLCHGGSCVPQLGEEGLSPTGCMARLLL